MSWVETLDNPDKGPADFAVLSISLDGAARAADGACRKLGLVREKIPTLPATTIFDAIQAFHFAVDVMAIRRAELCAGFPACVGR